MNGHAVAARTAAAVVALVAGAASFSHIADVAMLAGERAWVAWTLPLAIDGLIVCGVAALLEDRRSGRVPRMSARVAVVVGVVATLAANVASAAPTWTARAVAVSAPVSFLLSVEVLTRTGRPRQYAERVDQADTPVVDVPRQRTTAAALAAQRPDITPVQLAELAGVSERHARRVLNGRKASHDE